MSADEICAELGWTDSMIHTLLQDPTAIGPVGCSPSHVVGAGLETPAQGHQGQDRIGFNPILSMELSVRSTQQLSITLPNEMADLVRAKVATGEYATESEVIRDGLRTLLARDRALEGWLREQVAPAYDALKADPSRAVSGDEVRARLSAEHKKATKTR
jgi:antitoxin ParD1/3/4